MALALALSLSFKAVQTHDGIEARVVGLDLLPIGQQDLHARDLSGLDGGVQGLCAQLSDVHEKRKLA